MLPELIRGTLGDTPRVLRGLLYRAGGLVRLSFGLLQYFACCLPDGLGGFPRFLPGLLDEVPSALSDSFGRLVDFLAGF